MAPEGGRTHVKAGTLAATAAMSGSIRVRTRLVFHWAEIAVEQEPLARRGRAELERDHTAGEMPYKLTAEFHPAMIAIAACAHALDALYAEFAELVGPETLAKWAETRRPGRWAEVAGILELASARELEEWRPRLRTLFVDRRNPAVHPSARDRAPARHPVLPVHVPPEYTIYSVEAVDESVDLLLEILSVCVEAPGPRIEAWANDARPLVENLKQLRAALTS